MGVQRHTGDSTTLFLNCIIARVGNLGRMVLKRTSTSTTLQALERMSFRVYGDYFTPGAPWGVSWFPPVRILQVVLFPPEFPLDSFRFLVSLMINMKKEVMGRKIYGQDSPMSLSKNSC